MNCVINRVKSSLEKIQAFYRKYEKFSAPAVFVLGFAWDALTLRRIDNLFDNLCLLGYLVLIGAVIILNLRLQEGARLPGQLRRVAPRFPWVMQFCFGGLFSSYVVFYFKSVSFTRSAFFFLILVGLLIGNEFLEDRLQNRTLLAALYSFCCFSFLAFFLPVVLRVIHPWVFVLAGVLGAAFSLAVFLLGLYTKDFDRKKVARQVGAPIAGVFLLLNVLYFADLIPPVPLALKTGHPYHAVVKTREGFEVKYVAPSFIHFWRAWDDPFYWTPGENVYCFTAIFAPEGVRVPLLHVWSRKTDSGWLTTDRMPFIINGGRDGGYRWYSRKKGVRPGLWRVEVQTATGQILGEVDFTIKEAAAPRPLQTELIP
ncbi:MAG: DUF2914 domain-containing protein [Acidobacteriota bacterium]|jgi:hypothetical protein|nr:DUF2914 domain-containing protein [Acidobacteriota bacterium]